MPLYEFVCQDCEGRFDALVRSYSATDNIACATCASQNVKRVVSSFAMVGGLDEPVSARTSPISGGCCGGSCGCGQA